MIIKHYVSVDFINRDSIQVVNFVQHDQNIPVLSVDLYSGGSKLELDLSSTNTKIYLCISLPNGAFANVESAETSVPDGKNKSVSTVTFQLGYNVFSAHGAAKAIVLITEKAAGSTEYTNLAGSSPIVFMIDKDPIQDGSEESLDQYYGLRGYIEDVSENVVKKTALSIPKEGEITPPSTMVYAPSIIINKTGKVTRKKWYPTDLPGSGEPETDSVSSGDFVRRNSSKEILVPWKHKSASGVETTDYVPAVSGKEVDSKIGSILNPLLEGLANPYIFAIQANVGSYLDTYITQKNNPNVINILYNGETTIIAGVTSVRFKNEGSNPRYIKYAMNGTYTTLTVHGIEEYPIVNEETVTLNGNMTIVEVT